MSIVGSLLPNPISSVDFVCRGVKLAPLVSVIIPCFNYARFLQDSVGSVLSQTHRDLECIIVDDGSTDDTRKVSEALISEDPRVKYVFKQNGGVSSARNKGTEYARGEWIQFLDVDDWIHEDKIAFQLRFFRNNGPQNCEEIVLFSDYESVWMTENQNVLRKKTRIVGNLTNRELLDWAITWQFTHDFPLIIHSMLFRASIFNKIAFNEEFHSYADIELETNLLLKKVPFFYTPIVGALYRQHQDSMSKDSRKTKYYYIRYLEGLQKQNKELLRKCPNMKGLISQAIRDRDKKTFERLMYLVRNSPIPVYITARQIDFNNTLFLKIIYYLWPILSSLKPKSLYRRFKRLISYTLH